MITMQFISSMFSVALILINTAAAPSFSISSMSFDLEGRPPGETPAKPIPEEFPPDLPEEPSLPPVEAPLPPYEIPPPAPEGGTAISNGITPRHHQNVVNSGKPI